MKIESGYAINQLYTAQKSTSVSLDQAVEDGMDAKSISARYLSDFQLSIESKTKDDIFNQTATFSLLDIGYTGKPIAELTQDEAKELISEDGFFGVQNTADRIADFVLMGAGDDVQKLQEGRDGVLMGLQQAESLWGKALPDMSYETIDKAIAKIDEKLSSLGVNLLDANA